jgi:hypothetical protein
MEYSTLDTSEEWKPIPSYEDSLMVSSFGRVKSLSRYVKRSDTGRNIWVEGRVLTSQVNKNGYVYLRVSVNGLKVTIRPHRIIAQLWIPNPENKREVNHVDGNKQNNAVSNLEWVTPSENQKHAIDNGLKVTKKGSESSRFKRSVDVFKNGEYITTLNGNSEMTEFGVDYRMISACLRGKRNQHKGFTFKVKEDL